MGQTQARGSQEKWNVDGNCGNKNEITPRNVILAVTDDLKVILKYIFLESDAMTFIF